MRFANRTAELAALRRWWAKERPRPALVWGRRRAGKTALLREFGRDLRAIFHTGAGRAPAGELVELTRQVHAVGLARLSDRPYRDWDEALDELAMFAAHEPLLVVFDEFPEIAATSPELPGILRAFLDRTPGRTQLRLLLCGSAVRHMEALQEHRAPLYGRFDLTLTVHPFTPSEAALMLQGLRPTDRALVYGLLGGMPLYLSWWDQDGSLQENLRELICRPAAPLLMEGQLVLATEVERGELPSAVLHAIAAGRTRHSEVKDLVRAEPSRTLDRLIELRLVERLAPVTETERSRRRIYRVADNFLAFYLKLVEPFRPEIERGLGESIVAALVEALDDHMGARWEAAFRDHIRRLAATAEIGDQVVAVGPFWTNSGENEIDAVALAGRRRRPIFAGEAKWAKVVSGPRIVADLHRKITVLPGAADDIALGVCAREQVRDIPDGVRAITAADIFG
ncbi:MAG: ATP-binding protein [Luteitalea sp.]|nr:ATP-binding protein [Luteitalea sp.]